MRDLLFPAVLVMFFVLAASYIRACSAIAVADDPSVVPADVGGTAEEPSHER